MIRFLFIVFALFFLLMFLMGFSVVRTFKGLFFGSGNKRNTQQRPGNRNTSSSNRQQQQQARQEQENASLRKKIFNKDEGEYVDYEEIKD